MRHGQSGGKLQRVGETATVRKALKRVAPPTAATEKLVAASVVVQQSPLDGEPAFMARQLVQCTLPHSNPGNVPAWTRRNGNLSLVVQPGWDGEKGCSIGYPYGTLPRLLLFWIMREVLRTGSRRLELGNSLSAFMRELDLIPASAGGGKRSDAKRLKEQMRRLFNCKISFQQSVLVGGRTGERWLNMDVAPKGELWWSLHEPEQGALWGSWIEVGEDFFHAIMQSPVPMDMRALRALKRSALALDLYALCVWKAFEARRTGKKQPIVWRSLLHQMGCSYEGEDSEKTFKRKAVAALRKVKLAYPALRVSEVQGGFDVLPTSGTAIMPKAPRRKKLEG